MEIKYFGHSCFLIKSKNASIVIDPYEEKTGLGKLKLKADIAISTHDHFDHNCFSAISQDIRDPFKITGPGEYEINGIIIEGIASYHDKEKGEKRGKNTIYTVLAEGVRICHLGDLGHLLSDNQLDKVGEVDILMIPVGGKFTIDATEAGKVINQIEPKIVIPMHYKLEGTSVDVVSVDEFLKQESMNVEKLDVLKIDKKSLPQEEDTKIVVLEK
jgi:L-ascorbate metabolism protein UlaG (beta-lactamase superfamily)